VAGHLDQFAACGGDDPAEGVVDVIVAAQVARVVVGNGVIQFFWITSICRWQADCPGARGGVWGYPH
jgi:hypothetical protein